MKARKPLFVSILLTASLVPAGLSQVGGFVTSAAAGQPVDPSSPPQVRPQPTVVTGAIVDPASSPVIGATVATSAGRTTVSGAGGVFRFRNHPAAPKLIRIDASLGGSFGFVLETKIVVGGEKQVGSIVVDQDADGDLLPDWYELNVFGTLPLSFDSDGDGLGDGRELLDLGTDPLLPDSDGDGFDDGFELSLGANPLVTDAGTTLTGQVELATGGPAIGAAVIVLGVEGQYATTSTGSGGFSFASAWPESAGPATLRASLAASGGTLVGLSAPAQPVPGGATLYPSFELGEIAFPALVLELALPLFSWSVADFNGDGLRDLIAIHSGQFSVSLGQGGGAIGDPVFYPGGHPLGHEVVDVNRDSLPDVVFFNAGSVMTHLGIGGGSLGPETVQYLPMPITADMGLGDLDLDGVPDMVHADNNTLSWHYGDGTGGYGPEQSLAMPSEFDGETTFLFGDVDGNGLGDLVLFASKPSGRQQIYVVLQSSPGSFAVGPVYPVADYSAPSLVHLNGDARLDLIWAERTNGMIAVRPGLAGGGEFGAVTKYPAGVDPVDAALGDFNADGLVDVAVTNAFFGNEYASVLLGLDPGGSIIPEFGAPVRYETSGFNTTLVVEDFDADGRDDIVYSEPSLDGFVMLQGRGDGTLSAPVATLPWEGYAPTYTDLADMDGDGLLDLVIGQDLDIPGGGFFPALEVYSGAGDGTFPVVSENVFGVFGRPRACDLNGDGNQDIELDGRVLLGVGDGTLIDLGLIDPSAVTYSSECGDFNADGVLDLAFGIRSNFQDRVLVRLGNGDGSFGPGADQVISGRAIWLDAGDLNGDGDLDLVVLNTLNQYAVLIGNGDGTLMAPQFISAGGANSDALALGDLDSDGQLDLAVLETGFDGEVRVGYGAGDGSFGALQVLADSLVQGRALALADMNFDGELDVVVSGNLIYLLESDGVGGYTRSVHDAAGDDIAIGDVNGDELPDMVFSDLVGNAVWVFPSEVED